MSVLGFFGSQSAVFELCSHFRLQYGIFLLITALVVLKHKKFFALFCLAAACNLLLVGILYIPVKSEVGTISSAHHELRLLDMNINFENRSPDLVNQEIQSVDADVVVIEELTAPLYGALEPSLRYYPYRVVALREDPFGIGIFSKTRFISSSDNPMKIPVSLVISAVIQPADKPVEIMAAHLLPPVRFDYYDVDKKIVDMLAKTAHDFSGPKLIVGDLNATPWSAIFSRLVEKSGLQDSEKGFGLQPTWPCGEKFFQIPIDHCLVSSDCKIVQRSVGNETGSDHKPLVLRVLVP